MVKSMPKASCNIVIPHHIKWDDKSIINNLEREKLSELVFGLLNSGDKYVFEIRTRKEYNPEPMTTTYYADLYYEKTKTFNVVTYSAEELFHKDFKENKNFWKRCKYIASYLFGKKYKNKSLKDEAK